VNFNEEKAGTNCCADNEYSLVCKWLRNSVLAGMYDIARKLLRPSLKAINIWDVRCIVSSSGDYHSIIILAGIVSQTLGNVNLMNSTPFCTRLP